jgi:hypothetical protein
MTKCVCNEKVVKMKTFTGMEVPGYFHITKETSKFYFIKTQKNGILRFSKNTLTQTHIKNKKYANILYFQKD